MKEFLNKYKYVIIFIVLTLLIACFIFCNSLKTKAESSAQSSVFVEAASKIFDPNHKVSQERMTYIVRKMAHITEFCLLGLSVGGLIASLYSIYKNNYIFMGLFLTLSIAVADEFIQSLPSVNRGSSVTDILIDFSGGITGIAVLCLIYMAIYFHKHNKAKADTENEIK